MARGENAFVEGKKGTRETLTFDDINLNGGATGPIPSDYGGLSWSLVAMAAGALPGPGFVNGVTSGSQAAYLYSTGQAYLATQHGTFTFHSVELTAGDDRKMVITVFGIHNNSVTYNESFTITDAHPKRFAPHWAGIDEIFFKVASETPDPHGGGSGPYVVIDDLVVGSFDPDMAGTGPRFAHVGTDAFGADSAAHHNPHLPTPLAVEHLVLA